VPLPSPVWLWWNRGNSYAKYCYKCTPLLITPVEQNPPWEADSFSGSQGISWILWNSRFVTLFTEHHLSLSWVRLIQATCHHYISLRSILIFLSLPSTSWSSKHIPSLRFPHQNIKLSIMQFSPVFSYFLPLKPKERPQPVLTLMWETKFYTHLKEQAKLEFCIL